MTDLRASRFYDLLPPNLRTPDTLALSHALDRQMQALYDTIAMTLVLALVEQMTEPVCDQVALGYNISQYRLDMDLPTKREMIRFGFQVNSRKGTAWAVERLVKTIFDSGRIEEWPEYGGEPYFFRILTNNMLAGPGDLKDFLSAIYDTKNVRSWLEAIILELRGEGGAYAGTVNHEVSHEQAALYRTAGDLDPPDAPIFAGMAYHEVVTETCILKGEIA